jgi:peptidylprolyl isomerase
MKGLQKYMKKFIKIFSVLSVFSLLLVGISGCSEKQEAKTVTDINEIKVTWQDDKPTLEIPSGFTTDKLQVKVLEEGKGDVLAKTDSITADYLGELTDGTKFDSSYDRGEAATFPLTGVIQGWTDGLTGKKVGSKVLLAIPPEMGYGDQATGAIPANAVLIFVVDIVKKG